MGFREKLAERQRKTGSLLCLGLDPLPEKIPVAVHERVERHFSPAILKQRGQLAVETFSWMYKTACAGAPHASMFKPQSGYWEAIPGGQEALGLLIAALHESFPDIPILLDCKRGDISRTQERYRVAHLEHQGADGMNFTPYMGKDTLSALVDKDDPGKAIVGVCYTSNPDARQIQDALMADGRPLWEHVAEWILQWAEESGVVNDAGLVMAAAYKPKGSDKIYSEHLRRCREIVGDKLWFLIPGIGAQGGFVEETVLASYRGPGTIAVNSSSEICMASSGDDYEEAAAKKAEELRDSLHAAMRHT